MSAKMTMTMEKEPINGLDGTEEHPEPEAEENEEPEDEVGGDAPGTGKLIHFLNVMLLRHSIVQVK
jgi:hypothetical protein